MSAVRPNFIPAGEDNSTVKQVFGRRRPNFVPDPNDAVEVKGDGADGQFEEARREAARRGAKAKEARWAEATATMNRMNTAGAIETLRQMPPAIREMHLLVEENGQGRRDVLQYFPAAGETAREVWRDYTQPQQEVEAPVAKAPRSKRPSTKREEDK